MQAIVGDFITALVSFGEGGLGSSTPSIVIQTEVKSDPDIIYRMHFGQFEIEDYDQRYGCHFRYRDDGRVVNAIKVLEIATSANQLVIDKSNIVVPIITKVPINDLYALDLCSIDYQYYHTLMRLPAVIYDLFLSNHNDVDAAQAEFIKNIRLRIY